MPREFKRSDRVADFVKRELSILLQIKMRDPRVGDAIVNDVVVSRDMSYAKVYVTLMGVEDIEDAREPIAVLNGAAGFLRSELAQKNTMRSTPKLQFYFDETQRNSAYISDLIDKAISEDKRNSSE